MTGEFSPQRMDNAEPSEDKCVSSYISEVKKKWHRFFSSNDINSIFRKYNNIKNVKLSTECVRCEANGCAANVKIDVLVKDGTVEVRSVNEGGNCVKNS